MNIIYTKSKCQPSFRLRNMLVPQHWICPLAIIAIRSPRISASSIKWVVRRIVRLFFSVCSRSHVYLLACGSIPDVGSSNSTTLEPPTRAIPRLTFLFIPPKTHKKEPLNSCNYVEKPKIFLAFHSDRIRRITNLKVFPLSHLFLLLDLDAVCIPSFECLLLSLKDPLSAKCFILCVKYCFLINHTIIYYII